MKNSTRPIGVRPPACGVLVWVLVLIGAAGCTQGTGAIGQDGTRLFAVSDTAGWAYTDVRFFRLIDGSIVAGSLDEPLPVNHFACTSERFENFELTYEARVEGEGGMRNGGVQFRSQWGPDGHEVIGYQADVGWVPGQNVWGDLYDEARRRRVLASPDSATRARAFAEGSWNRMRVRAHGDSISVWVNDVQTVDYVEEDPSISSDGIICFQVHSGPPTIVRYTDVRLRPL